MPGGPLSQARQILDLSISYISVLPEILSGVALKKSVSGMAGRFQFWRGFGFKNLAAPFFQNPGRP